MNYEFFRMHGGMPQGYFGRNRGGYDQFGYGGDYGGRGYGRGYNYGPSKGEMIFGGIMAGLGAFMMYKAGQGQGQDCERGGHSHGGESHTHGGSRNEILERLRAEIARLESQVDGGSEGGEACECKPGTRTRTGSGGTTTTEEDRTEGAGGGSGSVQKKTELKSKEFLQFIWGRLGADGCLDKAELKILKDAYNGTHDAKITATDEQLDAFFNSLCAKGNGVNGSNNTGIDTHDIAKCMGELGAHYKLEGGRYVPGQAPAASAAPAGGGGSGHGSGAAQGPAGANQPEAPCAANASDKAMSLDDPDFVRFMLNNFNSGHDFDGKSWAADGMTENDVYNAMIVWNESRHAVTKGTFKGTEEEMKKRALSFVREVRNEHDGWGMENNISKTDLQTFDARLRTAAPKKAEPTITGMTGNPKFIRFMADKFEDMGGNGGGLNKADVKQAIDNWNEWYGKQHGVISYAKPDGQTIDEQAFDRDFEHLRSTAINFLYSDADHKAGDGVGFNNISKGDLLKWLRGQSYQATTYTER